MNLFPELILVNAQHQLYGAGSRTAGFASGGLTASYTIARGNLLHSFGVNFFNVNIRLYRHNVSLIKNFAPEIGRGAKVSYTIRFF